MIRDIGGGFKASYAVLADGVHEVRFFRNGRKIASRLFRQEQEDDALKVFMKTTRDHLLRSHVTA